MEARGINVKGDDQLFVQMAHKEINRFFRSTPA